MDSYILREKFDEKRRELFDLVRCRLSSWFCLRNLKSMIILYFIIKTIRYEHIVCVCVFLVYFVDRWIEIAGDVKALCLYVYRRSCVCI